MTADNARIQDKYRGQFRGKQCAIVYYEWLEVTRRRRPANTSIPPRARAMAPTPAIAAMWAPVNANPPPDEPLLEVPPLVVAETTTIDVEEVLPLVFPVAMIVWLLGVVSAGIVTVVLNEPWESAVVVPRVTGVLWRTRVTVSPGLNPDPVTINEPSTPTVEVSVLIVVAFGP